MRRLRRLFYVFLRNPAPDHHWICTLALRYWGTRMITVHFVRYKNTQYGVAFWVGHVGSAWPHTDEPMYDKWEVVS